MQDSNSSTFVHSLDDIHQHDVLLGLGSVCAGHVGTIAFKAVIESRMDLYVGLKSRKAKTALTLSVLAMLQAAGSRFFRQECRHGSDAMQYWRKLNTKEARLKIRDAFRDLVKNVRNQRRASALLDNLGLSNSVEIESTFADIVEYVSNSSSIREYIVSRNDTIQQRKKKRFACFLKQNPEYASPSPILTTSADDDDDSTATVAVATPISLLQDETK